MSVLEEKSEANLELLLKELEDGIKNIITPFNDSEIALCSGKIRELKLKKRSLFIDSFEKQKPLQIKPFYVDECIDKVSKNDFENLTTNQKIADYFSYEMNRAKKIRDRLTRNCSTSEVFSQVEPEFVTLFQSLSAHITTCQNIINGLTQSTIPTYSDDDLIMLLKGKFVRHLKKLFLHVLKLEAKQLIVSRRYQIMNDSFNRIEADLTRNNTLTQPEVPVMIAETADLDKKLISLATRFGVTEPMDSPDAQRYLYICDKYFTAIWSKLENISYTPTKTTYKINAVKKTSEHITEESYLAEIPIEQTVNIIWEKLASDNFPKLLAMIKSDAGNYNTLVNGEYNKTRTVLTRREPLQLEKVNVYFRFRTARAKWLFLMIQSQLNMFEAMLSNICGSNYTWRESKEILHLIDVLDENGNLVMLSSAQERFEDVKTTILKTVGYYTNIYEEKLIANNRTDVMVDREQMIINMLEDEAIYLNAKRKLLQCLYECAVHHKTEDTIRIFAHAVADRAYLNVPLNKSYKIGYNLAIQLINKQADVISSIIKVQVLHERHISAILPNDVPLFDRLCISPAQSKLFIESVPISPHETFRLSDIPNLIELLSNEALSFCEQTDIKKLRYTRYVELSLWNSFSDRFSEICQYLPFSLTTYPFKCELSSGPYSLISSPIINTLSGAMKFMENVPKSRRTRFLLNLIVAVDVCWELQDILIKCDALQDVYISQSSRCGFNDPKVYMNPFTAQMTHEVIDIGDIINTEKVLDFGMTDYDRVDFNFSKSYMLMDDIISGHFKQMKEINQFQKLHYFIMDVAVRYNFFLLDNDIIVDHFSLAMDESSDFFLTQAGVNGDTIQSSFIRSFMAPTILLDAQYIVDNYKKAQENRDWYFVNIRAIKKEARLILNAQAKQQSINYETYISQLLDVFSGPAYRMEVAFVCRIFRQFLLLNAFSDAFIIEPTSKQLVTESGNTQNSYIIPIWGTIFIYCRSAPIARQGSIFKAVLSHVCYIYRLNQMIRFECSLSQPKSKVLIDLTTCQFQMETTMPQRIYNELSRIPGYNEFDVSSRFLCDKVRQMEMRQELAIYSAFEQSFLTMESNDANLRSYLVTVLNQMSDFPDVDGMVSLRYSPSWCTRFFCDADESSRQELLRRINLVDQRVDGDLAARDIRSTIESYQAVIESITFMGSLLAHYRLKFAFFCLYSGIMEFTDPLSQMTPQIYSHGNDIWDERIVSQAHHILAPHEDEIQLLKKKPLPEIRIIGAQIEALRNECDKAILTKQFIIVKQEIERLPTILSPDRNQGRLDPEMMKFSLSSNDINNFFDGDAKNARARLVHKLSNVLKNARVGEIQNGEQTINFDIVERKMHHLTPFLYEYEKESLEQQSSLWHGIFGFMLDLYNEDNNTLKLIDIFEKIVLGRYDYELATSLCSMLGSDFLKINNLEDKIRSRKKAIIYEDIDSTEEIKAEFDTLLYDLRRQKDRTKKSFAKCREELYGLVQSRLKAAGEVQFSVERFKKMTMQGFKQDTSSEFNIDEEKNDERSMAVKKDIEALRKKITVMRIVRCMSNIATRRFFIKRIASSTSDMKFESAKMWEGKRDFEVYEESTLASLKRYYRALSDNSIEAARMRVMIDSEKQNTIQLVHWKALNAKKEDELNRKLKQFDGVGDVDVSALLHKLEAAQATLNKLKEDSNKLDAQAEIDIRRPMTAIERTRKKIVVSKIERTRIISERVPATLSRAASTLNATALTSSHTLTSDGLLQTLQSENEMLSVRNEYLRRQIADCEAAKNSMPPESLATMETVVVPKKPKPEPRGVNSGRPKKDTGITRPFSAAVSSRSNLTNTTAPSSTPPLSLGPSRPHTAQGTKTAKPLNDTTPRREKKKVTIRFK